MAAFDRNFFRQMPPAIQLSTICVISLNTSSLRLLTQDGLERSESFKAEMRSIIFISIPFSQHVDSDPTGFRCPTKCSGHRAKTQPRDILLKNAVLFIGPFANKALATFRIQAASISSGTLILAARRFTRNFVVSSKRDLLSHAPVVNHDFTIGITIAVNPSSVVSIMGFVLPGFT